MASRRTGSRDGNKPDDIVVLATNRRARHKYTIESVIEAGLLLRGSEVKSLRQQGGATIAEGYARVEDDELWLMGVHIPPLPQAGYFNHEPVRRRKCLVHRKELRKLTRLLEADGCTLIPLRLYFRKVKVKVELGVGRGLRKGDRRQREKEKDDRRRIRESSR